MRGISWPTEFLSTFQVSPRKHEDKLIGGVYGYFMCGISNFFLFFIKNES